MASLVCMLLQDALMYESPVPPHAFHMKYRSRACNCYLMTGCDADGTCTSTGTNAWCSRLISSTGMWPPNVGHPLFSHASSSPSKVIRLTLSGRFVSLRSAIILISTLQYDTYAAQQEYINIRAQNAMLLTLRALTAKSRPQICRGTGCLASLSELQLAVCLHDCHQEVITASKACMMCRSSKQRTVLLGRQTAFGGHIFGTKCVSRQSCVRIY